MSLPLPDDFDEMEPSASKDQATGQDHEEGHGDPAASWGPLSRRGRQIAAILVVTAVVLTGLYGADLFAWVNAIMNPRQTPCTPVNATVADILGPSYPLQSLNDSAYRTGPLAGGIPHKRDLSPPCTITNARGLAVPTFVQVSRVYVRTYGLALYDCSDHFKYVNGGAPYPNHQVFCDYVGDILSMGTTSGQIHVEFDQDWQAKGFCGPAVPACDTVGLEQYMSNGTISVDIRGFVYWDDDHWELHPATAWKLSSMPMWP